MNEQNQVVRFTLVDDISGPLDKIEKKISSAAITTDTLAAAFKLTGQATKNLVENYKLYLSPTNDIITATNQLTKSFGIFATDIKQIDFKRLELPEAVKKAPDSIAKLATKFEKLEFITNRINRGLLGAKAFLAVRSTIKEINNELQGTNRTLNLLTNTLGGLEDIELIKNFGNKFDLAQIFTEDRSQEIIEAVKKYNEFNDVLTKVNTVLKLNKTELEKYGKNIQEIVSKELKNSVTSTEALAGAYEVASAGITEVGANNAVLTAGLKLAASAQADSGETLQVLVKTLQAYSLSATNAADVAGKLNAIVDQGIITIPDLSSSFAEAAGIASQAGISIDDLGASFAVLSKTTGASEAATQIRAVAREISSGNLQQRLDAINATVDGTRLKIDRATVAAIGLPKALALINKAVSGNQSKFNDLFPDFRAFRGAITLAKNNATELQSISEKIAQSGAKTLQKVFDIRIDDSQYQNLVAILNRAGEIIIKLGRIVQPLFDEGSKSLDVIVSRIEKFVTENQGLIKNAVQASIAWNSFLSVLDLVIKQGLNLLGIYTTIRFLNGQFFKDLGSLFSVTKKLGDNAGFGEIITNRIKNNSLALAENRSNLEKLTIAARNILGIRALESIQLDESNNLVQGRTKSLLQQVTAEKQYDFIQEKIAQRAEIYNESLDRSRANALQTGRVFRQTEAQALASFRVFQVETATALTGIKNIAVTASGTISRSLVGLANFAKLALIELAPFLVIGAAIGLAFNIKSTLDQFQSLRVELTKVNQAFLETRNITNKLDAQTATQLLADSNKLTTSLEKQTKATRTFGQVLTEAPKDFLNYYLVDNIKNLTTGTDNLIFRITKAISILSGFDAILKAVQSTFNLIIRGWQSFKGQLDLISLVGYFQDIETATKNLGDNTVSSLNNLQALQNSLTGDSSADKFLSKGIQLTADELQRLNAATEKRLALAAAEVKTKESELEEYKKQRDALQADINQKLAQSASFSATEAGELQIARLSELNNAIEKNSAALVREKTTIQTQNELLSQRAIFSDRINVASEKGSLLANKLTKTYQSTNSELRSNLDLISKISDRSSELISKQEKAAIENNPDLTPDQRKQKIEEIRLSKIKDLNTRISKNIQTQVDTLSTLIDNKLLSARAARTELESLLSTPVQVNEQESTSLQSLLSPEELASLQKQRLSLATQESADLKEIYSKEADYYDSLQNSKLLSAQTSALKISEFTKLSLLSDFQTLSISLSSPGLTDEAKQSILLEQKNIQLQLDKLSLDSALKRESIILDKETELNESKLKILNSFNSQALLKTFNSVKQQSDIELSNAATIAVKLQREYDNLKINPKVDRQALSKLKLDLDAAFSSIQVASLDRLTQLSDIRQQELEQSSALELNNLRLYSKQSDDISSQLLDVDFKNRQLQLLSTQQFLQQKLLLAKQYNGNIIAAERELSDNLLSIQNLTIDQLSSQYDRIAAKYSNFASSSEAILSTANSSNQGLQSLYSLQTQYLEQQLSLATSLADRQSSAYNLAVQSSQSEAAKYRIQKEALNAESIQLSNKFAIESRLLDIATQQKKIELELLAIQTQANIAKEKAALAQSIADNQKLQLSKTATAEEKSASQLKVTASLESLKAAQLESALLSKRQSLLLNESNINQYNLSQRQAQESLDLQAKTADFTLSKTDDVKFSRDALRQARSIPQLPVFNQFLAELTDSFKVASSKVASDPYGQDILSEFSSVQSTLSQSLPTSPSLSNISSLVSAQQAFDQQFDKLSQSPSIDIIIDKFNKLSASIPSVFSSKSIPKTSPAPSPPAPQSSINFAPVINISNTNSSTPLSSQDISNQVYDKLDSLLNGVLNKTSISRN